MLKKLFFALIVAAVALSANAEKKPAKVQIHLRNGQVVTSVITERDERVVTIANDADHATYHYTMDEINYIDHLTKKKNYDTSKFRGFIDLGYSMGVGAPRNDYWLVETSFGYAFTPKTYIGLGVAIHDFKPEEKSYPMFWNQTKENAGKRNDPAWRYPFIPFYLEGRYNFMNESKNTPFVSLKVGGTFITTKDSSPRQPSATTSPPTSFSRSTWAWLTNCRPPTINSGAKATPPAPSKTTQARPTSSKARHSTTCA